MAVEWFCLSLNSFAQVFKSRFRVYFYPLLLIYKGRQNSYNFLEKKKHLSWAPPEDRYFKENSNQQLNKVIQGL